MDQKDMGEFQNFSTKWLRVVEMLSITVIDRVCQDLMNDLRSMDWSIRVAKLQILTELIKMGVTILLGVSFNSTLIQPQTK
jgi:hypothetical protein